MTETPYSSRESRAGGTDFPTSSSLGGLFRSWLRGALGTKSDANWRETIEELIEEGDDAPDTEIAAHERKLIANVLRLRELTAVDIMVPRADIVAVDIETPMEELREILGKRAHSRIPVYRESLDDVVGLVHIKDVVTALGCESVPHLREIAREVSIVAPSMPLLDLLLEMRQSRQHMALVVDEFGGIDGLITIEDVVEEIVGEIQDEHDVDVPPHLETKPDGSWIADARLPVEDFEAVAGAILEEEEREDIDTLGGLVFTIAGRVPVRGELLTHAAGFEFEVIDSDPRRIKRLRVRRCAATTVETPAAEER